jgi:uncharacterized protein (TIGR02145 family)
MKKLLLFLVVLVAGYSTQAQVKIGNNPTTIGAGSILELEHPNKALVVTRVADTAAVTNPVAGMMIYDISSTCFKVYQNGAWSNCINTTTATPVVTAVCNGFIGSYCTAALSGTTYTVTMTNNDFSGKQVTPLTGDLVLSGISGVNVTAVNPTGLQTINAGANLVITYTISGTPAAQGTLTGTFTKQGLTCSAAVPVGGVKTVAAASSAPTLCINTALTAITHATTNATGIGVATGLPAGVTAAWAGNTITISGTPSASGTFNYSIPVNGCGPDVNAMGTITVTPDRIAGAASATPTVLKNVLMANITHTTTNATGIGTPTNLPAGVTAAWAANLITISGTPTAAGTFNYTIPLVGCGSDNATGTITVVTSGAIVNGVFKEFLPYNLGVTGTQDPLSYQSGANNGDLYQWGRPTDGHQVRNSAIIATQASNNTATLPATVAGKFIYTSTDWRSVQTNNLWGDGTPGENPAKAANDPCPTGYKVPSQAQWGGTFRGGTTSGAPGTATQNTWTWTGNGYMVGSLLYIPAAGYRYYFDASSYGVGKAGYYWSSTVSGSNAYSPIFANDSVSPGSTNPRELGASIRCIAE